MKTLCAIYDTLIHTKLYALDQKAIDERVNENFRKDTQRHWSQKDQIKKKVLKFFGVSLHVVTRLRGSVISMHNYESEGG